MATENERLKSNLQTTKGLAAGIEDQRTELANQLQAAQMELSKILNQKGRSSKDVEELQAKNKKIGKYKI